MSRYIGKSTESSSQQARIGVLVTNLGTPEAPTTKALRSYLRVFLSDPRVVEVPRVLWMMILYCFILPFRPAKSAKLYQSIWTKEGSPLLAISKQQAQAITEQLTAKYGSDVCVKLAMRYGNPSINEAMQSFCDQGIDKLIVLPLYPQYAGPTTASTFDAVTQALKKWRKIPNLDFISGYHDNPLYIQSLANSVTEYIQREGKPDKLVLSYHGMPELFREWGDPYYDCCKSTTQALAKALNMNADDFVMTFQSRFGKAEWLKPYTDATLEELPTQGSKNVAIMSPAFSADCLETLEELEGENREVFIRAGGAKYHYIPALNHRADHINALVTMLSESIDKKHYC